MKMGSTFLRDVSTGTKIVIMKNVDKEKKAVLQYFSIVLALLMSR